ncbi:MAG TPA: hypothetical protein VIR34_20335 [Gemmatimonadaceae bacterium]|jgi:hypothetical protein|nr:hypothetical protein [Gaiella sp.]
MAVVEDATQVTQAGSWILSGTHGSTQVCSLVPNSFEDYARIFHPAARKGDECGPSACALSGPTTGVPLEAQVDDVHWREVRWRDVAEANGKIAHPAMQWRSIIASHDVDQGTQPGLWDRAPQRDSLPLRLTCVLCEILAKFTRSPDRCWCAVWEGYSYMVGLRSDSKLPRLAIWNRPMIVACGSLSAVPEKPFTDGYADAQEHLTGWESSESYRSPSLWWPDDRAWYVATDVDMQETYVGASGPCVNRLLADERLETMRVTADQDVTWKSDVINRPQSR